MPRTRRDASNSVISLRNEAAAPCSRDDDQIQPKRRKRHVPHAPTAHPFEGFDGASQRGPAWGDGSSVAAIRKRRSGKVFHAGSWKGQYGSGEWSSQLRGRFKAAAEGMSTDVRNCTFGHPRRHIRAIGRSAVRTRSLASRPIGRLLYAIIQADREHNATARHTVSASNSRTSSTWSYWRSFSRHRLRPAIL